MTAPATDDPVPLSYPDLAAGDDRPAHVRIEEWLERLISSSQLKLEDRLPSEVDMAGALGVSRMTLRQALNGLESKGLLVRKRGRWGGSFVARPRFDYELSGLPGFTEQMRRSNALAGARVIEAATINPEPEVREALRLLRRQKVHRIVRVRGFPFVEGAMRGWEVQVVHAAIAGRQFRGRLAASVRQGRRRE